MSNKKSEIDLKCNEDQKKYFLIHSKRFELVIDLIRNLTENKNEIRLLDIGPSFLTKRIKDEFDEFDLECLGLIGEQRNGGHLPSEEILQEIKIIEFDLNKTVNRNLWPQINPYDIIIIAEVIEHLYVAPEYVLRFLRENLKKDGIIILQTPNAVCLIKRLKMITGKNPYEMIRLNYENPGHFREYTIEELKDLAGKERLTVKELFCENYLNLIPRTWKVVIYQFLQKILGKNFKDGITVILTKSDK